MKLPLSSRSIPSIGRLPALPSSSAFIFASNKSFINIININNLRLRQKSTISKTSILNTHPLNSYALFRRLPNFTKSHIIYFYTNPKSYLFSFVVLYEIIFGLAPLSASWYILEQFPLDSSTSEMLQSSISSDLLQKHNSTITEILKQLNQDATGDAAAPTIDPKALKQGVNAMTISSWMYPFRVGFSFFTVRKFNDFFFGKYLSKNSIKDQAEAAKGEVWNTELNSKIKFKNVNSRRL